MKENTIFHDQHFSCTKHNYCKTTFPITKSSSSVVDVHKPSWYQTTTGKGQSFNPITLGNLLYSVPKYEETNFVKNLDTCAHYFEYLR